MPLYTQNQYEVVSISKTYQDLRHLGWYYHFLNNGYGPPTYRDRPTEGKRLRTS